MERRREHGQRLLDEFKGDRYVYGPGVLAQVGGIASGLGKKAAIIRENFPGSDEFVARIEASLKEAGVVVSGVIVGARPNCPARTCSGSRRN